MLTLLATLLKLQFSLTTMFAATFSMAMRNVQVEAAELQLEADRLEAQGQLQVIPAEKVKPAKPAKPAEEVQPAE